MGASSAYDLTATLIRERGEYEGLRMACRHHLVHGHFPPLDPCWDLIAREAVLVLAEQMDTGEIDYRRVLTVDMGDGKGPREAGLLGVALQRLHLDDLVRAVRDLRAEADWAQEPEEPDLEDPGF